jgi:hypothetical protein
MAESRLIVNGDLGEFFREEVKDAQESLGLELPELTEFYLVNLLCDYSRGPGGPELGEEPLALRYKRALEARPAERFTLLKSLGDESLYVAGFFAESIERSLVDVGYYISMGGTAYGSLSELLGSQRRSATFAVLYEQLARGFPELVGLLNEVSDRARGNSDSDHDLLRLYERWLRTKSTRTQRLLHERGVLVRDVPDDDELH